MNGTSATGTALAVTPAVPQSNVISPVSGRIYPLHSGARQIIQHEEDCYRAETSGQPTRKSRVRFANRVYRMIDEIINDASYNKGDYISVQEIVTSQKIYQTRVSTSAKMAQRENAVKAVLPAVIHAFNYYWLGKSPSFALIKIDDEETGKTLGVSYPQTQDAIDRYLHKLNKRAAIAEEVMVTANAAIKQLQAAPQVAVLPSSVTTP